jgi:uncharacterized heparinase superfamily protein
MNSIKLSRFAKQAKQTRWYWARFATMGPREVAHRAVEYAKKVVWKNDRRGWQNFATIGDGQLADFGFLRERLAHASDSAEKHQLIESVRRIRAGEFEFMGLRWPTPDPTLWRQDRLPAAFWLHDPVSGKSWPGADTYCFAADHRDPGAEYGDVKYVWELNRLQFLHPVAVEIARKRDAALTRWAMKLLASWADAHPPFRSINWKSGIELALRLVSLLLLVSAAAPTALNVEERVLVRRLIAAHGYWLHRFPSRFSSANNHAILEGLGLFIAGALAPDLPHAQTWAREGRAVLEAEAMKQILPDGVGAEQSPTYQAFIMEAIALAALLADNLRAPLSPGVLDRLTAGAEYLGWLQDDAGKVPAMGDDDEGRVIAQPPDREPRYVASIVASVAGLAKRPDLAPTDHTPHLRDSIFGAPTSAPVRADGIRIFPAGGYTVVRDTIAGRRSHFVFDHGPLGYLSLAAHGHADALALWLTLDDQPIFVDAGTYLYHAGRGTRDRLRESAAHNTLLIADRSQSTVSGPFIWADKATARLVASSPWPDWSVSGEHDGYRRLFGVDHVRQIARDKEGISITDRLEGASHPYPVTLHFLCHPQLTVSLKGKEVVVSRGAEVFARVASPAGFRANVIEGENESGRGWHSPRFGEIAPTSQIVLSGEMNDRVTLTRIMIVPPGAKFLSVV